MSRVAFYIRSLVSHLNLDLSNKVVVTELATNAYFDAALIPLFAGAKRVIFVINTESSESQVHLIKTLHAIIEQNSIKSDVVIREKYLLPGDIIDANIICNTGALRPLDYRILQYIDPRNAVIQLMYDVWEMRDFDIDLDFCRSRGITVVGTNESTASFDVFYNVVPLMLKMCLEVSRVYRENIFIFSNDDFGNKARMALQQLNPSSLINSTDIEVLRKHTDSIDLLILCDYKEERPLMAHDGILNFVSTNPNIKVVHLFGVVDADFVESKLGLGLYPAYDGKNKKMSKTFSYLGSEPVIDLFAASYKAGASYLDSVCSELIQEVK